MPDVYNSPIPFEFAIIGAATVGLTAKRKVIGFDYEIVGVSATANTAPTGASLILDLVAGPAGTIPASLTTIWPVTPANRPTILAGANDQAAIAAGSTTVAPVGTDPSLSGQSAGVSTTYVNYDGYKYLAKPDPSPVTTQFGRNGPDNTGNPSVVINTVEGGTLNQATAPANVGFQGHAGDSVQLNVIQVGSTVAGSDITVIAFLIIR